MTTNKNSVVKRFEAVEVWFWIRMIRISWTENMTNEDVLHKVGMK